MTTIESLKEENLRLKETVKNLTEALDKKTLKRYKLQAYFFDKYGEKWFIVDVHYTAYSEEQARNYLHRLAGQGIAHSHSRAVNGFNFNVDQVEFEKEERTWVDDMADRFL